MKKVLLILIALLLPIFSLGCNKSYNASKVNLTDKEPNTTNNIYIVKENNSKTQSPINTTFLSKYNKETKEDLIGKSKELLINIYVEPFYEIAYLKNPKDIEPEYKAFIYLPDSKEPNADNSALTIILKNNLVLTYKIDDFNGLSYSRVPYIFDSLIK